MKKIATSKTNHAYHHMLGVLNHVVAQRDLRVFVVLSQSALHTANGPNASVQILQDLWYFQLWVTVCDYCILIRAKCCNEWKILCYASQQAVIPVLVVVSISNNALVIHVIHGFSQRFVRYNVHRKLGVFYWLITASDIWLLLTNEFLFYWLEDGLALTTGGHFSVLTLTRSSLWHCAHRWGDYENLSWHDKWIGDTHGKD